MKTITQEDKDLLLKDLCARLPYGIKISYKGKIYQIANVSICNETITIYGEKGYPIEVQIKDCKPYLFSLSSMTEEQRQEYNDLCSIGVDECGDIIYFNTFESVDWLNKNHFDYRNLIGKNLAIDCTNFNIY